MPLSILRLNQKHQLHPNDRIVFIKPLPGPFCSQSELFLKKIAAICYPIMKAHHLSVTTLEEFPANREFMGRNFNAGEVIQLVLRRMSPRRPTPTTNDNSSSSNRHGRIEPSNEFVESNPSHSGSWLSFNAVAMVMMHELAHCIEMNHTKAFWNVRTLYADHLRVLFHKGYTGEGSWGRGQMLESGREDFGSGRVEDGEFVDLCGGTYRGRRKGKAKEREKVTYQERKRRRVEKVEGKFGKGNSVGEDESTKVMLEGRVKGSKPRVAGSKRGRELRAAAALARFDQNKIQERNGKRKVEDGEDDDETESGSETESDVDGEDERLRDGNGKEVVDAQGNGLYRVCGDTDVKSDSNAMKELDEMNDITDTSTTQTLSDDTRPATISRPLEPEIKTSLEVTCPICSLSNPKDNLTCHVCSQVLQIHPGDESWQCRTKECLDVGYRNSNDAGVCGLCGQKKSITL